MAEEMDERFSHVVTDPRFRTLRKSDKKIKVDKRFEKMFTEKRFRLKYSIDKRGKEVKDSNCEDYHKFYNLSDSEKVAEKEESDPKSDEEVIKVEKPLKRPNIPNPRGMDSDSDVVEDSSSSDSEEESDESEDFDHKWNEWDKDVPQTESATKRLAVCNIDWERIDAKDLFVLFNSFKPFFGSIVSVKIFPSELGLQRMKEESESGPIRFIEGKGDKRQTDNEINDEEEEEDENKVNDCRTIEKLRQYELTRLKYFYGVVEVDSEDTANHLYKEVDGMEYETSSSTLDLRFIPEDMTFGEEVEPKSVCYSMPDMSSYKAPVFVNIALQQSRVRMTWDETDPKRKEAFEKAFAKEDNDDLKAYLASSDSEEDEEIGDEELIDDKNDGSDLKTKDKINKYKELLTSLSEPKKKVDDSDEEGMEMEVSWEPNLKDVAEDIVAKKGSEKDISFFEKNYLKNKEKRKENQKKQKELDFEESIDNQISDTKTNSKKQKRKKNMRKNVQKEDPDLELLVMDSLDNSDKNHFNYKNIVENKANKKTNDSFKFNAEDPRFGAVYTSHHYNIDPSDPHFKRTDAFDQIISRSTKRIKTDDNPSNDGKSWTQMVKKVKNKSKMFDNKKGNQMHVKQNKFKT